MKELIIIRGGGDLATGVVQKFFRTGFRVIILETEKPTAIRRNVSLCEAVYNGTAQAEDVKSRRIENAKQLEDCWEQGLVPLMIDPAGEMIKMLKPNGVIDAIIAKKNLGTNKNMAKVTVGLGPGFSAGEDVHVVVETMRGHNLGRLIFHGAALPNTGTPGELGGQSTQRVIHSPTKGIVEHKSAIGDRVEKNQSILTVDGVQVVAPFAGLLRGLITQGLTVPKGMKIADIDPRVDVDWQTISDKARCLGGAALEAYLMFR